PFPASALAAFRREIQCRAVHAIALPGRLWTVREHVAEMCVAGGAADLNTPHEERAVFMFGDGVLADRGKEARPAGPGIKFGARGKQRRAAGNAPVEALALFIPMGAAEGAFRSVLASDVKLLGGQLLAPFRIRFHDF